MDHAIETLRIALATAQNNERVFREGSKYEEAARCRDQGESILEGLSLLTAARDGYLKQPNTFEGKIAAAINCHSLENGSDTPDFILAAYLKRCLENFDLTMQHRATWVGPQDGLEDVVPPIEQEYRLLEVGEVIQIGDEYHTQAGRWIETRSIGIEVSVMMEGCYRRPITEPKKQEYRLLEAGEFVEKSDEYNSMAEGCWVPALLEGRPVSPFGVGMFRRPL